MIEPTRRVQGFTLLEMMISLVLFGIVGGSVGLFLNSTMESQQTSSATLHLESKSRTALVRMKSLLQPAFFTSMNPRLESPWFASSLDFQRAASGGGGPVPMERLEWRLAPGELDDGADNDGNGLIDDGQVVWTERLGLADQQEHILLRGVSEIQFGELPNGLDDNGNLLIDEAGLSFSFVGRTMTVRLTVEGLGPRGALLQKSFDFRMQVRN